MADKAEAVLEVFSFNKRLGEVPRRGVSVVKMMVMKILL